MGGKHTFFDKEFGSSDYDPNNSGTFIPNLVAVAMPFKGQLWDEVYLVIKNECNKLNLKPQRVDEYFHSGIVLRDISELIENSEFLIFDLSLERQNVYYELGYAHGVGNDAGEILLIAKEGTKLHYDISGLRVHYYDSLGHLQKILSSKLEEMVRTSRRNFH
jgi:hypothetical protein